MKLDSLFAEKIDINDIDFSAIFSRYHEGIVITDNKGVILYYNDSMGKIDDLNPADVLGKTILEVYDLSKDQSTTMRCLKNREAIVNHPLFYRTHLGKVTSAITNVYPLLSNGSLVGAICYTKDYYMAEKILSTSLPAESAPPKKGNGTRFSFSNIIGSQSDLSEAVRIAQMAADSPSPILIAGETGTGKELFAQSIHNHSPFRMNQFIPINCAAIPENLLEGILFGTSKGAFTGAIDKAGLFEQANDGTLFLDELNSMPLSLQTKLLRVIQEKKVRRIGSHREIDLNVKIISSVNEDPHEEINRGHLRLDLFYRLGVVFIQIPTLRERKRDLHKLINHFIHKFNIRLKRQVSQVSDEVLELFQQYSWPGNARELEHVIEGSMNMVGKNRIIEIQHLPKHFLKTSANRKVESKATDQLSQIDTTGEQPHLCTEMISADTPFTQKPLQKLYKSHMSEEAALIKQALSHSNGNVAKAVNILGLSSPQSLQYKMKKLNICPQEFRKSKS